MSNIYINKKQLSIIAIGLMSLTRDEVAFSMGIEHGAFTEDDIYEYIDTVRAFTKKIEEANGAMLSTEINFDDLVGEEFVDLWGNPID
jgi:hypothetical protein